MIAAAWQVLLDDEAKETWQGAGLTADDRIVIRAWIQIVEQFGPQALQLNPSVWNDHPIFGKWAGHRASNFSNSGRVIYYVADPPTQAVLIRRITASHDYRPLSD